MKVYSQVSLQEPPQASHCTVVGKCSELILVDPKGVQEDKCGGKVCIVETYQGKSKSNQGLQLTASSSPRDGLELVRPLGGVPGAWLQVLHGSLSGLWVDLLLQMFAGPMQDL